MVALIEKIVKNTPLRYKLRKKLVTYGVFHIPRKLCIAKNPLLAGSRGCANIERCSSSLSDSRKCVR